MVLLSVVKRYRKVIGACYPVTAKLAKKLTGEVVGEGFSTELALGRLEYKIYAPAREAWEEVEEAKRHLDLLLFPLEDDEDVVPATPSCLEVAKSEIKIRSKTLRARLVQYRAERTLTKYAARLEAMLSKRAEECREEREGAPEIVRGFVEECLSMKASSPIPRWMEWARCYVGAEMTMTEEVAAAADEAEKAAAAYCLKQAHAARAARMLARGEWGGALEEVKRGRRCTIGVDT